VRHAQAGVRRLIRGRGRAIASLAILPLLLGGCAETDSFLFDPSVMGRWEYTPTTVPILSRLSPVEPSDEFIEATDIQPSDLIPEVAEYRIGPGDVLRIMTFDVPDLGRYTEFQRQVDNRGYVDLPQIGEVRVSGLSVQGAQNAVMEGMRQFTANPLASVVVDAPRSQQITVIGAVQAPGPYYVTRADYRLLDALGAAGGFSEAPQDVYVIRQRPLTESAGVRPPGAGPTPENPQPPSPPDLPDIINELSKPPAAPPPATQPPATQPPAAQPPAGQPPATPPGENPPAPAMPPRAPGSPGMFQPTGPGQPPTGAQPAQPPLIDLPPTTPGERQPQAAPPPPPADTSDSTYVQINGRWVRVPRASVQGPGGRDVVPGAGLASQQLVTQRVIRIPTRGLASGDARFNVIIRPGDVIRVPPPPSGTVYVSGLVNRPGTYSLIENVTLDRIVAAAGGLLQVSIPERVDIIRMVGRDRQAIVRVNLRAIAEGTEPDIFLKNNDMIRVGTNFWATPLAVIRNGFRMTYGFGFLVDRNFGSDIFGAPPDARIQ
jgi:polysaccharide export outer membrane protein